MLSLTIGLVESGSQLQSQQVSGIITDTTRNVYCVPRLVLIDDDNVTLHFMSFPCSQILSISGDGKVLVWQMSPGSHDLKLVSGFLLQTDSVPRSMRLSKARGDTEMGGNVFLNACFTCIWYFFTCKCNRVLNELLVLLTIK